MHNEEEMRRPREDKRDLKVVKECLNQTVMKMELKTFPASLRDSEIKNRSVKSYVNKVIKSRG